jgi:serine/threonine-protein kinase
MKPENVFIHRTEEGDEIVKIVDFGIAQLRGRDDQKQEAPVRRRLTRTGVIFGTPEYMSPEQAAGRNADLRVDVYAVGVILYEMFTGAVPFSGETFMAVLSAHLTQPVPPMRSWVPNLDISPELEAVVMRALAKTPDERYQSMSEFAQDLQQTPEGRLAAPLAALLPIPKVTRDTFRPARGASAATAPHFVLGQAPPKPPLDAIPIAVVLDEDNTITPTDLSTIDPSRGARYRRRWGLVLVGMAVLFGAVGIGVKYRRATSERVTSARANPSAADVTFPSVAAEKTAGEAGASSVPNTGVVPADQVTLTVSTEPAGAVLFKGGFQVCDATPCTLVVGAGEAMELEGRKGTFKGSLKVLAQRDQSVSIVLIPAPPIVRRSTKSESSKSKLCEVVVDGLKILRPCAP